MKKDTKNVDGNSDISIQNFTSQLVTSVNFTFSRKMEYLIHLKWKLLKSFVVGMSGPGHCITYVKACQQASFTLWRILIKAFYFDILFHAQQRFFGVWKSFARVLIPYTSTRAIVVHIGTYALYCVSYFTFSKMLVIIQYITNILWYWSI